MGMSDTTMRLAEWFSNRHWWLQNAATLLLEQATLTDEDISKLALQCLQEVQGKLPKPSCTFPLSSFSPIGGDSLRLCSISNIEGINALAPKKPLEFCKCNKSEFNKDNNLTIIYGHNGSGKSGYIRLLKHVCGAREKGILHNNVYKRDRHNKKACISFVQNGIQKSYIWSDDGVCNDLSNVEIFDNSFGKIFVDKGGEVTYEPPILSFLTSLIQLCEKVAASLEDKASRHQSRKPSFPSEKNETAEGLWYKSINVDTSTRDIDNNCTFSDNDDAEILALQQRLAELSPADQAKRLEQEKVHIDRLVRDAQTYLEQLSTDNCRRIIAAKVNLISKEKAANIAAAETFSGSELEGIGGCVR